MKKILLVFILILLSFNIAEASKNSIVDFIEDVDEFYYLAVGTHGRGGDSIAASDIALMLLQKHKVDIEPVIETEISEKSSMILVGHPCDIDWYPEDKCNLWPYEEGEALIEIGNNVLTIAGSTVDDTRRAAKILANYQNYTLLEEEKSVIVKGDTLIVKELTVEKKLTKLDFTCGDGICMTGEKFFCHIDCKAESCFEICVNKDYDKASCRETPSNPNVRPCTKSEANVGLGYCAAGRSCCCINNEEKQKELEKKEKEEKKLEDKPGFFKRIGLWFKKLFYELFYEQNNK